MTHLMGEQRDFVRSGKNVLFSTLTTGINENH